MKPVHRLPSVMLCLGIVLCTSGCSESDGPGSDHSEGRRIPQVILTGNPDDGTAEFRLSDSGNPGESVPLFVFGRSASVSFHPEGEWCAIHDMAGSNFSSVRIFRRYGKLDYREVSDLDDAAWRFFETREEGLSRKSYDHTYLKPLAWLPGRRPLLLLSLTGYGGSGKPTSGWLCLYDAGSGTFLTEFDCDDSDDAGVGPDVGETAFERK